MSQPTDERIDIALEKLVSYKEAFKKSPFGMGAMSLGGEIVDLSDELCALVGYTPDELIGKQLSTIDHPSDQAKSKSVIQDLIKGGQHWQEYEKRFIHKDGSHVWVRMVASVIRDESGDPLLLWTLVRDISAQKKLEIELSLSESRLNQVVDSAGLRFIMLDPEGLVSYMSADVPGAPADQVVGTLIWPWLSEGFRTRLKTHIAQVIETGVSVRYDHEVTHTTGERRQYSDVITPVFTEDKVTSLTVSILDITRTRDLEDNLKLSNELVALVTSKTEVGVWELDVATEESDWDQNMFRLFGRDFSSGSPKLSQFLQSLIPDDRDAFIDVHTKAIDAEGIAEGRFRVQREDADEMRWVSFRSILHRDLQGKVLRYLGIAWDGTKEQEREMSRIRAKELEVQNRDLKQFAYLASHDLKGPLGVIENFGKLLQDNYKGQLDECADKSLDFIVASVDRMKMKISDLMNYATIGEGKETELLDLNEIIEEVKKDLAYAMIEGDCVCYMDSLPAIIGYRFDVKLLLQNLMSNALKFRQPGVVVRIDLTCQERENHYYFEFSDNGIGIEERFFGKIFTLFQRLHVEEEFEGTGIGLAQCKKIVELHLGDIGVRSTLGTGTTFHFTLLKNLNER